MRRYFVDLHIHIGRTSLGKRVKVAAARDLTFENIAEECFSRKGIDVVGIVDCASPRVRSDIDELLGKGEMHEIPDGGIRYKEKVTIILGCEVETTEEGGGVAHHLTFFPNLEAIDRFRGRLEECVKNMNLSTQRCWLPAQTVLEMAHSSGGVFLPAHAFTPHKSIYGTCAPRLKEVFTEEARSEIYGIELGLSADTDLADRIRELADLTFLSNSDAHSLAKIGREYNVIELESPTFKEIVMALKREAGRRVVANFGLDPKLGKYHRTSCPRCGEIVKGPPPALSCPICGTKDVVVGVLDRIVQIQDTPHPVHPDHRPPYCYQIPLEFVPGIGLKSIDRLIHRFGSEMAILHAAREEELAEVVGERLARNIDLARHGELALEAGGGGRYGRVRLDG